MDVMVEVLDGDASQLRHRWPCRLEVGTATSGDEVGGWLSDHLAGAGVSVDPGWRWWTADGRSLADADPAAAVVAPGDTLILSPAPPPAPSSATVEVGMVAGSAVDPICRLEPGVHRIGGSPDDDVMVQDVPPGAAVVEVHASGAVDVRRRSGVDGGDEDAFFGSPTAGRAVRLTSDEVAAGERVRLGAATLVIRRPDVVAASSRRGAVNRTPYRPMDERPRTLDEVPAPPSAPRPSRMAITSFIVPLASGVGMAVLLGRPQFLFIVLLAPLALAVVHAVQRRRGRRTFGAERSEYRAMVAERAREAEIEAVAARADAHRALPSARWCLDIAVDARPSLWQRAAGGPHLLRARVGLARRPAVVSVPIATGGDDDLRAEAERTLATACLPPGPVPADVDLDAATAVGICGRAARPVGLVRALVAQFATHHGPEDVVVTAALSAGSLAALDGLAWLPHTRSEASPLATAPVCIWPDDVDELIGSLVEVAARRSASAAPRRTEPVPRIVVVVDQRAPVDRGALGQLLDLAPTGGVRVVWFGDDPALVPRQCQVTIRIGEGDERSRIESIDPAVAPEACRIETLDRSSFARLGRALAPRHDVASPARSGALPAELTLADLLGDLRSPTQVDRTWGDSDGASLQAPIGVTGSGPLVLDLVAHGPHALVAGTSGSGKSELLQTWVASMALHHPPERCTFLFVDYKGGATAAPFADLPHTVGSVTNLDPRLAQRALVSLRAELDRRMALLSGRAKDLREFAAVAPEDCPPRLVIVVDEFATLIKEIPDFVAGVVDVAQRGRSLGIHLVLATQRPNGAVNDDILANTTIRIALRVVDGNDSRSILGTEDAAEISTSLSGRGLVRLGPGAIGSVQVAWSTAPVGGATRRDGASRHVLTPVPEGRVGDDGVTQLAAVVEAVSAFHRRLGRPAPRRPWVPELPPVVTLASLESPDGAASIDDPGRVVTIGLADDPARQRRRRATVDLETSGGLVVFGTGGSGRTTALRTAAVSAVDGASVDAVQVVVLDFAGRSLRALLDLPHVRAVVTGDDLEGACREIEWLDAEVDRRRDVLGESRAETWSALVGRADRPPRLCVLIDGFAGIRGALDSAAGHPWWERLQRVIVDGRQVGIHVVMAADRRNDLPAAVLGSVGARLVLRMAEAEAMTTLGIPRAIARSAELPVGRGFLDGDEVQVAVLDAGGDRGPTGEREAAAVAAVADRCPDAPAPRAPGLPRLLRHWPDGVEPAAAGREAAIGVDERGHVVRLSLDRPALVAGPHGSGRSTLLRVIAYHAGVLVESGELDAAVLVADDRSPLAHGPARAVPGVVTAGDLASAADAVSAVLDGPAPERTLLVVDDAERFDAPPFAAAVAAWLDRGCPAVVAADRGAVGRSLTGMLGQLRRVQQMVIVQPDGSADVEALIGHRVRFRPGTVFPVGRAVVAGRRQSTTVQLKIHDKC